MRASELREKTDLELVQILRERRDALMHFRMQTATGIVDNVRLARGARKDIARVLTIQNQRKSVAQTAGAK